MTALCNREGPKHSSECESIHLSSAESSTAVYRLNDVIAKRKICISGVDELQENEMKNKKKNRTEVATAVSN